MITETDIKFLHMVQILAPSLELGAEENAGEPGVYGHMPRILCIIISVYNSSLRTEAGYMVYFVLAIPFVFNKNRGSKGEENAERIYEKHLAERKGEFR